MTDFPVWPPGFTRRVVVTPGKGVVSGALEDDIHRFHLALEHDGTRIVRARGEAVRHPWTACPGAVPHLCDELAGAALADVAARDPGQHCTHLLDLAILCAAHAGDDAPLAFDIRVADRIDGRTTAVLLENGAEVLRWRLDGTAIAGPAPWAGRDLRLLSKWRAELSPADAERAAVMRRAVFVSGIRAFRPVPGQRAADVGPRRMGACYNFQLPRAADSVRAPGWTTDFSAGERAPLED